MLQTSFPKLKKHHPTNVYMLYPMVQSFALVFIEIDKKMPPQWWALSIVIGSPLSIIRNHFGIQILNFKFFSFKNWINKLFKFLLCHTLLHTSAWTTVGAANTPQRAYKKPYRHGTDAPRHYLHTTHIYWFNFWIYWIKI